MPKVISVILLLTFSFFLTNPDKVLAATCTFDLEPKLQDQSMDKLKFKINSSDLLESDYRLLLESPETKASYAKVASLKDGKLEVEFDKPSISGWIAGSYQASLFRMGTATNPVCQTRLTINSSSAGMCKSNITSTNIQPDTDVTLTLQDLAEGEYDLFINGQLKSPYKFSSGEFSLGKFEPGKYLIEIKNRCGFAGKDCALTPQRLQCSSAAFEVVPRGNNGGGPIDPLSLSDKSVSSGIDCSDSANKDSCSKAGGISCNPKDGSTVGAGAVGGIMTAIGCVPTEPRALVEGILKVTTFGIGAVALLIMFFGALKMITADGNPEAIQAGKDQFTAAILGLLFIIFSVLLLQVIGVDILGILPKT